MPVQVVQVRYVRMRVNHRLMVMRMAVCPLWHHLVRVVVVAIIMTVRVLMHKLLVGVFVRAKLHKV